MTSRERVQKVLSGQVPDRLPFNFWMDRNLLGELDAAHGGNYRINHCGADVIESPLCIDWRCGLPDHTVFDGKTTWHKSPILDDITKAETLIFPNPDTEPIFSAIENDRRQYPDTAQMAFLLSPLDVLFHLRIMDNAMYDLYDEPEACGAFVDRVAAYEAALVERLTEYDVDIIYVAGDICASQGPILSREMLIRYCFEPLSVIIRAAKKIGKPLFYHTDGKVTDVLDLFVEYGVDGINPLQPHLNDIGEFKARYGDKLMLYGGLDNCYKIPDSAPEQVRAHVRETFEILGRGGGFIASSHDIPDYVPRENLDALSDELNRCIYE